MPVPPSDLRAFADLPPVSIVPDTTLDLFCDMAALIRTETLASAGLSAARLDLIELNLAAHYAIVSIERGGLTAQAVGQSNEHFHLISDKVYGLASTRFGQQALALDTSNSLTGMASSPLKALFTVVGDPGSTIWLDGL